MAITVTTSQYQFSHGRKPRGRGYWAFKLVTNRCTEQDNVFWSNPNQSFEQAVRDARKLAATRRAHTIVVMP